MSKLLIIKTDDGYQCPYCKRGYKEKFNISNHISICRFIQLSRREQTNEVEQINEELPTQHELFRIIQNLSLRIDKLEKDNTKLKYHNKKPNMIELLNTRTPPISVFKDWVNNFILPKVGKYMEVLYKQNLIESISLLIEEVIGEKNKEDVYPICSFSNKPLIIYVYRENIKGKILWEQMTNQEFEQLIKQITARYLCEFLKGWYAKHETLILENETYYEIYINYYQKISNEDNYSKFKKRIYTILKED